MKTAQFDKAITHAQRVRNPGSSSSVASVEFILHPQIIAADSANVSTLLDLAYCYHQLGDAVKSFSTYQQAIKLDPSSLHALIGQGNLLKEAKQPVLAVQSYQQALRIDANCSAAHTSIIALLIEGGRKDEALKYFTENVARSTLDASSYVTIGAYA